MTPEVANQPFESETFNILTSLVKTHIKQPRIGGRASAFLTVEPVLYVKIFQKEGKDREITIKSSHYPSDTNSSVINYEVTDSIFPDKKWLVDAKNIPQELSEGQKDKDAIGSENLFNKVLEAIMGSNTKFSSKFIINSSPAVRPFVMCSSDGEGRLVVDVMREVYGVARQ